MVARRGRRSCWRPRWRLVAGACAAILAGIAEETGTSAWDGQRGFVRREIVLASGASCQVRYRNVAPAGIAFAAANDLAIPAHWFAYGDGNSASLWDGDRIEQGDLDLPRRIDWLTGSERRWRHCRAVRGWRRFHHPGADWMPIRSSRFLSRRQGSADQGRFHGLFAGEDYEAVGDG